VTLETRLAIVYYMRFHAEYTDDQSYETDTVRHHLDCIMPLYISTVSLLSRSW